MHFTGVAQGTNTNDIIKELEEDRATLEISKVLRKIDSLLLDNSLTERTIRNIKTIKVGALVEAHLYDDALDLSNELLADRSCLNITAIHKLRLQRALLSEILEDFERSNKELVHIATYYESNPKDELYGRYLYRKSSFHRVHFTPSDDSIATAYALKAVTFGKENNFPEVSGVGKMLLAFLQKDLDTEHKYLFESLEDFKQTPDTRDDANIYLRLGRRATEQGDLKSALDYMNIVQEIGDNKASPSLKMLSRKEKSAIYEDLAMPDSALYYYKEYKRFDDESAFLTQQNRVSQINFKYEIDKRLTAKKETEERLLVEKANVSRLVWLLLFSAIGLVLTVYLWQRIRYKNKKITEQSDIIEEKNDVLKSTVETKEFYLKELNHRVKNNLSLILSLISFQKSKQEDVETTVKFDDLEQRVRAIAQAHQEFLYDEEHSTGKKVMLNEYLQHIEQGLTSITHRQMQCEIIADPLSTPIEIAMPLGIILNELITNSIKHTNINDTLNIKVNIEQREKIVHFKYQDSGAGYEKDGVEAGLGLFIIESMVSQLEGTMIYSHNIYDIAIPLEDE